MRPIESIIGQEEAGILRDEFDEMLSSDVDIDEVEDLLSDYGLEPDYLEQLLF